MLFAARGARLMGFRPGKDALLMGLLAGVSAGLGQHGALDGREY